MSSDLGRRIGLTIGALLVVRLGTYISIPGINPQTWDQIFRQQSGGVLGAFDLLDHVASRISAIGAVYLAFVCLLPEILIAKWSVPFYLGGTSLLILVCAILDLKAQLDQKLQEEGLEAR